MTNEVATGLMSGTSLDGLDIAWCRFSNARNRWTYQIMQAETISYPTHWENRLRNAHRLGAQELLQLHADYGTYIGSCLLDFYQRHQITEPGIIASHGHTIFHKPENGYTFQLGHGAAIAATTRHAVISDFRSLDVALKGQGAPLVPIGDQLLFGQYGYCLNLGGFANISFTSGGKRQAFDICPVNYVINQLVRENRPDKEPGNTMNADTMCCDLDGQLAMQGQISHDLLARLNNLPYYRTKGPKSLGAEWVAGNIRPLLSQAGQNMVDTLRTYYEHVAIQINRSILESKAAPHGKKQVLVTGGGAYNRFLMDLIRERAGNQIDYTLPDNKLIDFKEALVFAFLGVLWHRERPGCLSSVTGSIRDNIGGSKFIGC